MTKKGLSLLAAAGNPGLYLSPTWSSVVESWKVDTSALKRAVTNEWDGMGSKVNLNACEIWKQVRARWGPLDHINAGHLIINWPAWYSADMWETKNTVKWVILSGQANIYSPEDCLNMRATANRLVTHKENQTLIFSSASCPLLSLFANKTLIWCGTTEDNMRGHEFTVDSLFAASQRASNFRSWPKCCVLM